MSEMRTNVDSVISGETEPPALTERKTVGYIITEKKAKKLNFQQFADRCLREAGISLKPIDLNRDLEDQGPFDAIIHKISDLLIQADHGNDQALQQCHRLQEYLDEHSSVRVLDPLPSIRLLCDRYLQYWLLRSIASHDGIFTPNFVDLISGDMAENRAKIARAGVTFPMIVKPLLSHGLAFTHKMAVVFDEEGLSEVETPCVAQSFVPHDAVLYKVFVLGNTHAIIPRPSLKNFELGDATKTIFFDSHEVSKDGCTHHLSKMEDPVQNRIPPNSKHITAAVKSLRQCTGLSLFGLDIIVEKGTGKCYSIDINPFPSYDGVTDFQTHLLEYLKDQLEIGSGFRTNSAIIGKQREMMVSQPEGPADLHSSPDTVPTDKTSSDSAPKPSSASDTKAACSSAVSQQTDLVLWKPPPFSGSNTQLIPINQALMVLENHLSAYSSNGRSTSDVEIDYRSADAAIPESSPILNPQISTIVSRTSAGRGNSPADSGIGSASESEASDSEKKMKELALQNQTTDNSISESNSGDPIASDFGAASFFPSWKRIKRFYGIPKPLKSMGFARGPNSIDKDHHHQHHSYPTRTKTSSHHHPISSGGTHTIELKALTLRDKLEEDECCTSKPSVVITDSDEQALVETEPEPPAQETKTRSDTIP